MDLSEGNFSNYLQSLSPKTGWVFTLPQMYLDAPIRARTNTPLRGAKNIDLRILDCSVMILEVNGTKQHDEHQIINFEN